MLRCALWSAGAGILGLISMSGCTPGPVTARSAGDGTGGNAGSSGLRVIGRDASISERDGASTARGSAGAGGSNAREMLDAGLFADGPLSETPRLPVPDGAAADARTNGTDALRDASRDLATARAPRAGEVAIDELLVNPTGDDLGREWIELANRAAEPLDLSQLHLATAATDVAAPAGRLGPGALLLMGQS